jgi:hypothetical protein
VTTAVSTGKPAVWVTDVMLALVVRRERERWRWMVAEAVPVIVALVAVLWGVIIWLSRLKTIQVIQN